MWAIAINIILRLEIANNLVSNYNQISLSTIWLKYPVNFKIELMERPSFIVVMNECH